MHMMTPISIILLFLKFRLLLKAHKSLHILIFFVNRGSLRDMVYTDPRGTTVETPPPRVKPILCVICKVGNTSDVFGDVDFIIYILENVYGMSHKHYIKVFTVPGRAELVHILESACSLGTWEKG